MIDIRKKFNDDDDGNGYDVDDVEEVNDDDGQE